MKKVTAELKRLHSPDAPHLEEYVPDDPGCFCILLQAMYGPRHDRGVESFDLLVCNAGWLAKKADREGIFDGRHHLVVRSFDVHAIRSFLERYGDACEGDSWAEVATKLARLGHWEFEDYQST